MGSGDRSGWGGTVHWSFPRTCGTECYAGQESAAWPLLSKDSAGLGQRLREGGEEPGWKCAQDPRGRGRGALQCGWSSSGCRIPPLPPPGAGPGISFPLQS